LCVFFEVNVTVNYIIISREREHLEDTGIDGRIILRWIFRKWYGMDWTGLTSLWIGKGGGHLKTR
jgi:hypothetical protein